jgi:hypothetical protein
MSSTVFRPWSSHLMVCVCLLVCSLVWSDLCRVFVLIWSALCRMFLLADPRGSTHPDTIVSPDSSLDDPKHFTIFWGGVQILKLLIQIFKLCCTFREPLSSVYGTILSSRLVTIHQHVRALNFLTCRPAFLLALRWAATCFCEASQHSGNFSKIC